VPFAYLVPGPAISGFIEPSFDFRPRDALKSEFRSSREVKLRGLTMRVTLVTETYFPQVNGVSRTLGQLVRHLSEAGDSVQLVLPDYDGAAGDGPTHRVRSIRLPFYKELHLPLPPFGAAHRAIDRFGPDLIHIATEATLGLSVLRHARRRGIPVVSSFHTNFDQYSDHYGVGWARGTIWRYMRWYHNQTRQTYVPSRPTIRALEARGFERLVLWPRGVDSLLFRPDRPARDGLRRGLGFGPDDVVIGYVGRIAVEKNVGFLADALAGVAAGRPNARFLFVGDGPARAEVERRMGPQARFVGYRSGDDLADHYAAADLFAFSSLTETFGNVVLEALASGLPVIALRAGGIGDIVQSGVDGLLLDPDTTPDAFARSVMTLVDDVDLRSRFAAAARAYAISQSWDTIMEGLRNHYVQVSGQELPIAPAPALIS
jgi:glycosyltransferase involved in cell wall biosynthesis